jgi:Secretion system C-terminal sorting domain
MKKQLHFILFLFLFIFILNEIGIAQVFVNTGNVLFRVDDYGAVRVQTFQGADTLYQIDRASVLVAGNPDEVLDYWNDVDIVDATTLVPNPQLSDFEITGTYNNAFSGLPPNVLVGQNLYAWNGEDCALIRFDVTNEESSALPTIVGLDIVQDVNNTYESDTIYFNQTNNIFYQYENTYVGIKILSEPTAAATSFIWYDTYTASDTGYYNWLTGGISTDVLVTDPDGGVGIMGTGSQTLQPQGMRTVYIAIAVGNNESSMLANMALAEGHYGNITDVKNEEVKVLDYRLNQNYPNPFNPTTMISFSIPQKENVTLNVYNLLGQKVAAVLNSELESGSHAVSFNAENLSAGIYFYTIKAGNFVSTKKMMLLK